MSIHKTSVRLPVPRNPWEIEPVQYRVMLVVVDRLPKRLLPALARSGPLVLLANPRPRQFPLLWLSVAASGIFTALAVAVLWLRPVENPSIIRMAIPPLEAGGSRAVKGTPPANLAGLASPPAVQARSALSATGAVVGLPPKALGSREQAFVRVDDLPPAQGAVERALKSGVAEPWSDIGVKGYAVAGPVQLADNRVCRIVAIWAETGSQGGGVTSTRSFCRTASGGWIPVEIVQPNPSQSDGVAQPPADPAIHKARMASSLDTVQVP